MIATAVGRNWHASWWEWHLLILLAFAVIALCAHRQWHEERFSDLYLEDTSGGTRETADRLSGALTESLGEVTVKGREAPVDALLLVTMPPRP